MKTNHNLLNAPLEIIQRKLSRLVRKDFLTFFKEYLESYQKNDYRVMKQAYDKYMLFVSMNEDRGKFKSPDARTVRRFVDFLQQTSKGTGEASTYGRFRKAVLHAVMQGILKENPCSEVKCIRSNDELVKDILSEKEILMLIHSHYNDENQEIRKAFIFSLYTGIRFCDVKSLRYCNIDYSNRLISFEQSKTKGSSSRSMAYIPLREDLMVLLSLKNRHITSKDELLFNLPSHPTCLKHLRKWTKAAGISKHITWHSARHSFATNILKNGADIKVVADLLGHSSLKYVEKYTRAVDQMKVRAVYSLPEINTEV